MATLSGNAIRNPVRNGIGVAAQSAYDSVGLNGMDLRVIVANELAVLYCIGGYFHGCPAVAHWHTTNKTYTYGTKINDLRRMETEGCDGGKGRDFV
jgi:hypothetical protein